MDNNNTQNNQMISFDTEPNLETKTETETIDNINVNSQNNNVSTSNENVINNDNTNQNPQTEKLEDDTSLNNNESNDNEYNISEIYNFLKDNGIAPEVDDLNNLHDIKDVANLISQHEQQIIQENLQKQLENYPQNYKDLFQYVQNGGKVEDFVNSYRDTYSDLDINMLRNNTSLQEKAIYDYYKNTTNWDDNFIKSNIDKYSEDEKAELSKKAIVELKNMEQYQKEQLLQQQQVEQQKQLEYKQQIVNDYVKQIDELNTIGDIELNIKDKNEIKDYLFNDITYNKLNENFDKYRLNLAILDKYGLLDDPTKLTNIVKSLNNSKQYNFKSKQNNSKQQKNDDAFNFDIITQDTDKQIDKLDLSF